MLLLMGAFAVLLLINRRQNQSAAMKPQYASRPATPSIAKASEAGKNNASSTWLQQTPSSPATSSGATISQSLEPIRLDLKETRYLSSNYKLYGAFLESLKLDPGTLSKVYQLLKQRSEAIDDATAIVGKMHASPKEVVDAWKAATADIDAEVLDVLGIENGTLLVSSLRNQGGLGLVQSEAPYYAYQGVPLSPLQQFRLAASINAFTESATVVPRDTASRLAQAAQLDSYVLEAAKQYMTEDQLLIFKFLASNRNSDAVAGIRIGVPTTYTPTP